MAAALVDGQVNWSGGVVTQLTLRTFTGPDDFATPAWPEGTRGCATIPHGRWLSRSKGVLHINENGVGGGMAARPASKRAWGEEARPPRPPLVMG